MNYPSIILTDYFCVANWRICYLSPKTGFARKMFLARLLPLLRRNNFHGLEKENLMKNCKTTLIFSAISVLSLLVTSIRFGITTNGKNILDNNTLTSGNRARAFKYLWTWRNSLGTDKSLGRKRLKRKLTIFFGFCRRQSKIIRF